MTKMSIDIDQELLSAGAAVLGTASEEDTVLAALREIVAMERREEAYERLHELVSSGALDPDALEHAWRPNGFSPTPVRYSASSTTKRSSRPGECTSAGD
jgi:Arc/MetJ family transcription regulator